MANISLPKHPLERKMKCPICGTEWDSIPIRRGATPDNPQIVMEQHVCPVGHVYVTEPGKNEMIADW